MEQLDEYWMVRAWGYEVLESRAIGSGAHIAEPHPVVIVREGLSADERARVAWKVLEHLVQGPRHLA